VDTPILANDERGVAIEHLTATRNDKTLDAWHVLVCDIRDGKLVNVQGYDSDEQQNAFWS
jgi:hypothetical protein